MKRYQQTLETVNLTEAPTATGAYKPVVPQETTAALERKADEQADTIGTTVFFTVLAAALTWVTTILVVTPEAGPSNLWVSLPGVAVCILIGVAVIIWRITVIRRLFSSYDALTNHNETHFIEWLQTKYNITLTDNTKKLPYWAKLVNGIAPHINIRKIYDITGKEYYIVKNPDDTFDITYPDGKTPPLSKSITMDPGKLYPKEALKLHVDLENKLDKLDKVQLTIEQQYIVQQTRKEMLKLFVNIQGVKDLDGEIPTGIIETTLTLLAQKVDEIMNTHRRQFNLKLQNQIEWAKEKSRS